MKDCFMGPTSSTSSDVPTLPTHPSELVDSAPRVTRESIPASTSFGNHREGAEKILGLVKTTPSELESWSSESTKAVSDGNLPFLKDNFHKWQWEVKKGKTVSAPNCMSIAASAGVMMRVLDPNPYTL